MLKKPEDLARLWRKMGVEDITIMHINDLKYDIDLVRWHWKEYIDRIWKAIREGKPIPEEFLNSLPEEERRNITEVGDPAESLDIIRVLPNNVVLTGYHRIVAAYYRYGWQRFPVVKKNWEKIYKRPAIMISILSNIQTPQSPQEFVAVIHDQMLRFPEKVSELANELVRSNVVRGFNKLAAKRLRYVDPVLIAELVKGHINLPFFIGVLKKVSLQSKINLILHAASLYYKKYGRTAPATIVNDVATYADEVEPLSVKRLAVIMRQLVTGKKQERRERGLFVPIKESDIKKTLWGSGVTTKPGLISRLLEFGFTTDEGRMIMRNALIKLWKRYHEALERYEKEVRA